MIYLYFWIAAQIILEMLPISSSGHLALLELLLKKYAAFDIKEYFSPKKVLSALYYFLHGPTLLIVTLFFFTSWRAYLFTSTGIAWHLIVALIIADSLTIMLYYYAKSRKTAIPLGLGFCITMAALFSTFWCTASKAITSVNFLDAALLGLAQGLAVLPGVSRLALTTGVGCWLGYSVADAFFLSWTMQVLLMAAAFIKSLKDLHQLGALKQVLNLPIGLVMLGSSGIGILIMNMMLRSTCQNYWYLFGWYMIVPLAIWIFLVVKKYGGNDAGFIQKGGD